MCKLSDQLLENIDPYFQSSTGNRVCTKKKKKTDNVFAYYIDFLTNPPFLINVSKVVLEVSTEKFASILPILEQIRELIG